MARKIKYLYWWNSKPNVGDASSKPIVEWMLGYKVKFAVYSTWKHEIKCLLYDVIKFKQLHSIQIAAFTNDKILYAVGSIIDDIGSKAIIWGSGLGRSYSRIKGKPIIWAVRGYLTLNNLPDVYDKTKIAVGDPAVLLPLIFIKRSRNPKYEVGLIPHFEDYQFINNKYGERYKIIDIRTTDVSFFIDEVLNCRYILSTAMHGIIISHAYGVPAIWIRRLEMNVGDFKFADYFSSVDIPIYDGFSNIDEILSQKDISSFFNAHQEIASVQPSKLKEIQQNLIKSFKKTY